MMYGWSVLHCLPVGMADKPSCGTGTVMRPSTLERYSRQAGFVEFEILPIDNFFLSASTVCASLHVASGSA